MAMMCSPLDVDILVYRLERNGDLKSVYWQILYTLAMLDGQRQQSNGVLHTRQLIDGIINVLECVWKLWMHSSNTDRDQPIAIDRAIAAAILPFARVLRDRSLQTNCRRYAKSHGF